ncbi:hypothetical protein [Asticcacaulis sp. AND118]|uniref:hypothetical protein n=1 Tax=Asticcacaulis sp. AND118 TaxID=2840468 RepID=UPI001CFFD521|nr:hypothetical protein [Asticcacaulis sp. AND118]UDF05355.1 hypothetical protein LH365_14190 [Asticcacaulis sp. AND118]
MCRVLDVSYASGGLVICASESAFCAHVPLFFIWLETEIRGLNKVKIFPKTAHINLGSKSDFQGYGLSRVNPERALRSFFTHLTRAGFFESVRPFSMIFRGFVMSKNDLRCSSCIHAYCGCLDAANDNFKRVVKIIPDRWRFRDREFMHQVIRALMALGFPRRDVTEFYAEALRDFDGILLRESGELVEVEGLPDDDFFGQDLSYTCIRDIWEYVTLAPANDPSLRLQARCELLTVALRIKRPGLLPLPGDARRAAHTMTLKEARQRR